MKKITIAMIDEDKAYAIALSKAIALMSDEFEIYVSNSMSELDSFDLILVSKKEWLSLPEANHKKAIILTETKFEIAWNEPVTEKLQLYKYDCISIIVAALRLYYATIYECVNPFLFFEKQPFVIGVFSGSGGIGTTSVSILLARELTDRKRKKVLFLSLEELESTPLFFQFPENHPFMGDYLYYLFSDQKKRNAATFYSSFQHRDSYGVEVFYPSVSENELATLSIDEINSFIESIAKIGNYDFIVLDIGNHLSKEMVYWLEHCNQCILLGNDTRLSAKKNKKRLERLKNQYRFDDRSLLEYCILKDEDAFIEIDKKIEIRSNYELGSEVKEIANRVKQANAKQISHERDYGYRSFRDQYKDRTDNG